MFSKIKLLITCFIALLFCITVNAQFWSAADLGVLADGTNQTTNLQTAINRTDVQTIWFSNSTNTGPALFRIDGTVSIPVGKVLKFEAGNRLTGTGTINGGIIDASLQSWIFDDSITVNPRAAAQGWFSVKWFGATGDNSTNDQPDMQRAINTCIRNALEKLFVPQGRYRIHDPLILKTQTTNPFCTLTLSGENTAVWSGASQITADFDSTFAIGIHLGKGCKISNLFINGRFIAPPLTDAYSWFSQPFSSFKAANDVTRDKRYSPYSGIVIDPFNPNGATPDGDPGYPGLQAYYGYNPGNGGGSTATTIEDLTVTGFVVGICSSPNGGTANAEITKISRVRIQNVKLCVSAGQDQEKMNVIDGLNCWGNTHTIFATGEYGKPSFNSGNWILNNFNLAGSIVQFISNQQGGWFPIYVNNIYAESIGSFGTLNSLTTAGISNGSQVSNSIIDFMLPSQVGTKVLTNTDMGTTFKNCAFRYYGTNTMMMFGSSSTFEDCKFSGVPVQVGQLNSPGQNRTVYQNCTAGNYAFGVNTIRTDMKTLVKDGWAPNNSLYLYNNQVTLMDQGAIGGNQLTESYTIAGKDMFVNFLESSSPKTGLTIVNHQVTFSGNTDAFKVGAVVVFCHGGTNESFCTPWGFGIVQSLGAGTITINNISQGLADGDYYVTCLYPAVHKGTFMGDITGPNTISNIARDFGEQLTTYPDFLIKTPYNNSTNGWVKVLSYDAGTKSFTTLGNKGSIFPANVRDTGLYFNNDATKRVETNSTINQTVATSNTALIWYKGEEIIEMAKSDKAVHYKVCKTGYNKQSTAPVGETRIAQLCPADDAENWKVTGNNISNGNNIFGTLTNDDVKIKTNNTDVGIITKTGKFGIRTQTPNKDLEVNGEARITTLPATPGMERVVFANNNGDLKSLSATGNPLEYLSGTGTWMPIPIIGPSGITVADQGLTTDGTTVVLGDDCNKGGGKFITSREINMNNLNLYFNSEENGKIYMGHPLDRNSDCRTLFTRLEISSLWLPAKNDYATPDPSLSGLRFTDLTAHNDPIENKTSGVLSLDEDGDVIWVKECCSKKGDQVKDLTDRMNRMETMMTKMDTELKAKGLEILQLKSKLDRKLKKNKIFMIGAALFSVFFGGHVIPGTGK